MSLIKQLKSSQYNVSIMKDQVPKKYMRRVYLKTKINLHNFPCYT